MNCYFINTLGNLYDNNLCVLSKVPEGIGIGYYKMTKGVPIGMDYPNPAIIQMSPEYQGLKLSSLIGHVKKYLILERPVVDVLKEVCSDIEIEFLPFTLMNHKGRNHSDDYFIVNPIGTFDCLNVKSSAVVFFKKKISRIDRYVFLSDKINNAPPIFRIPEMPNRYIINESLADIFKEKEFTNILLTEIEQK